MKKIVLIGSGNVATHLATALRDNHYTINQVYSRTLRNAKKLATIVNAHATNRLEELISADLIIISIKDDSILKIVQNIKKDIPIIHTSGSIDLQIFKGEYTQYGVLYPLQTFNKDIELEFSSIPICIEANNKILEEELIKMANSISKNVIRMNSIERKQLHIAAVFSSNFSNHMFTIAQHILTRSNINPSILLPLIKQTIKKLETDKAKNLQTGPARRRDNTIIEDHISNIKDENIKEIYRAISQNIIDSYE